MSNGIDALIVAVRESMATVVTPCKILCIAMICHKNLAVRLNSGAKPIRRECN